MNVASVSRTEVSEIGVLKTNEETTRCRDPKDTEHIAAIEEAFNESRGWSLRVYRPKPVFHIEHLILEMRKLGRL